MKKVMLLLRKSFLVVCISLILFSSCVSPYRWIDANNSMPANQSIDFNKSISINKVLDSRTYFNFNRSENWVEKSLAKFIKKEFEEELSKHFVIKDSLSSDIGLEIEIKEFDYVSNKYFRGDRISNGLTYALFLASYLNLNKAKNNNPEYTPVEGDNSLYPQLVYCCDKEYKILIGSFILLGANTLRITLNRIIKPYYLEEHKIKFTVSLFDKNQVLINSYEGFATGLIDKYSNKISFDLREYTNGYPKKINNSFSEAINEIIEGIYKDNDLINNHFKQ